MAHNVAFLLHLADNDAGKFVELSRNTKNGKMQNKFSCHTIKEYSFEEGFA